MIVASHARNVDTLDVLLCFLTVLKVTFVQLFNDMNFIQEVFGAKCVPLNARLCIDPGNGLRVVCYVTCTHVQDTSAFQV